MVQDVVNIGESLQGIDGGMVEDKGNVGDSMGFGVLEFIEHHLL